MGCGLWVMEYDTVSLMMGKRARSGEMRNEKREMRILKSGRHTGRYSKYRYRRPRPGARPAPTRRRHEATSCARACASHGDACTRGREDACACAPCHTHCRPAACSPR